MPPEKVPAYKPLPPLGSDERKKIIDDLAVAFGGWDKNSPGAVQPEKVYDILSQLNYHDRITLCYQVFRQQGHPDFVGKDGGVSMYGEPERFVRLVLAKRLSTGADNKRTFVGANRFFHLMSDAPNDPYHTELMNSNIQSIQTEGFKTKPDGSVLVKDGRLVWIPAVFSDKDNDDVAPGLKLFLAYDPGGSWEGNPAPLMKLLGIQQGAPPLRVKDPLGQVVAPQYEALPPIGSPARKDLVAKLNTAMGKTPSFKSGKPSPTDVKTPYSVMYPEIGKDFKGVSNPDEFFRLLGQLDYPSRLEIYREVLVARGETNLAIGSEYELRQSLMFGLMYTADNKKTFSGLEKYLRLVADAPRVRQNDVYMQDEILLLSLLRREDGSVPLAREFDDKNDTAVKAKFQRYFSVGGQHKELLPFDFYNRMELIGIPVGKPPLSTKAPTPTPAPMPAPAPVAPPTQMGLDTLNTTLFSLSGGKLRLFPVVTGLENAYTDLTPPALIQGPLQPSQPIAVI